MRACGEGGYGVCMGVGASVSLSLSLIPCPAAGPNGCPGFARSSERGCVKKPWVRHCTEEPYAVWVILGWRVHSLLRGNKDHWVNLSLFHYEPLDIRWRCLVGWFFFPFVLFLQEGGSSLPQQTVSPKSIHTFAWDSHYIICPHFRICISELVCTPRMNTLTMTDKRTNMQIFGLLLLASSVIWSYHPIPNDGWIPKDSSFRLES